MELDGKGVHVALISADRGTPSRVLVGFLTEHGVPLQTYQQMGPFKPLAEGLHPEWSGEIPATFVYDEAGTVRLWPVDPLALARRRLPRELSGRERARLESELEGK